MAALGLSASYLRIASSKTQESEDDT